VDRRVYVRVCVCGVWVCVCVWVCVSCGECVCVYACLRAHVCMPTYFSVSMKYLSSQWTDFHEILMFHYFLNL
jgi:hypothetical protein